MAPADFKKQNAQRTSQMFSNAYDILLVDAWDEKIFAQPPPIPEPSQAPIAQSTAQPAPHVGIEAATYDPTTIARDILVAAAKHPAIIEYYAATRDATEATVPDTTQQGTKRKASNEDSADPAPVAKRPATLTATQRTKRNDSSVVCNARKRLRATDAYKSMYEASKIEAEARVSREAVERARRLRVAREG